MVEAARRCHQAGDLRQAEQLYRRALEADPGDWEAWYRLGEVCQGLGNSAEAVSSYRQALGRKPDLPDAHYNLGNALAAQGQYEEAVVSYRLALQLQPGFGEAWTNLGITLAKQGQHDAAVESFQQALHAQPDLAKADHNLGVAFAEQGRLDQAVASLQNAVQLRPAYAEAHYNLGNVLDRQGKRDEAVAHYRQAVRHRPDYVEARNNLGLILTELGRPAEAVIVLQQAVRLRPGFAEAHTNLGLALADLGTLDEAVASYQEALRLNPRYPEAHTNLGSVLALQKRLDEALASYQEALWLHPDHPSAHWNRALALLQMGDYERGWPEYEWRWKRPKAAPRQFRQPLWDGSPLAGRTILLHMEQGLGDAIQFIRYTGLLKGQGARVLVECHPILVRLLATCPGIDQVIPDGQPLPECDTHVPLLSLPARLGTTLTTVPAEVPYLHPEEDRIAYWREQLRAIHAFRVGIAWQGNPYHKWDRRRSLPLARFEALARLPGVRLISLQRVHGLEQLQAVSGGFQVTQLENPPGVDPWDFVDTAAAMKNVDLVITPDTATAHLAGALGVPVWVALATVVDWRWLLDREDSPWYPTMRLFRQTRPGEWGPVFRRMAAALKKLARKQERSR